MEKFKSYLIGKPLKSSQIHHEKFTVLKGLPVLSSDAISSVAYACEEILWILVPAIGMASFRYLGAVSLAIIALLSILVFSYRQTIDSYPKGGGSYIVSRDNLGVIPSLIAGASLTIDYILTVAVSTTAGVAAITSAVPSLLSYKVQLSVFIIIIMCIGNLRGIRDSSKYFSLPTYLFIGTALLMIITGLVKYFILGIEPVKTGALPQQMGDLTIFMFLKAFSGGCTALTGIEAVSDGVPNFQEPASKHAKQVLYALFGIVIIIFGGMSLLASVYHAVPSLDKTVISQIAEQVFGQNTFLFFLMQVSTTLILVMAANTAFSDFPLLLSFVARDGYAPRQLSQRGSRLSFSNGIILLSIAASILIIVFKGQNHYLLPLYAVGVFISFTLSQSGMVMKWVRGKEAGWKFKAFINGFGALITLFTAVIISVNKFVHGAWIVFILIPLGILVMMRIKKHYQKVADQLSLENNYFPEFSKNEARRFIVPVAALNEAVIKTISYAKCLSNDITAFHISIDQDQTNKLKEKWKKHDMGIPLVIKESEYRDIVEPLVSYINSEEFCTNEDDIITVVVPQFVSDRWWGNVLHNQTALMIKTSLLKYKNIAAITVPYIIKSGKRR